MADLHNVVAQGADNTGGAAILQPTLPAAYNRYVTQAIAYDVDRLKKNAEARKRLADKVGKLEYAPVWENNTDWFLKEKEGIVDYMTDSELAGVDVTDPVNRAENRAYRERLAKFEIGLQAQKDAKKWAETAQMAIEKDDTEGIDKEKMLAQIDEMMALTDPIKQGEYVRSHPAIVTHFNPYEATKDLLYKPDVDETGVVTVTAVDPQKSRDNALEYLRTAQGQQVFKKGVVAGTWADEAGYADWVYNQSRKTYQESKRLDEPRQSSGSKTGATGGSYSSGKYVVTPTSLAGGDKYDWVDVSYTGGINDPVFDATTTDGKAVSGKLHAYKPNPDGSYEVVLRVKDVEVIPNTLGKTKPVVKDIPITAKEGDPLWTRITGEFGGKTPKEAADAAWATRKMKQVQPKGSKQTQGGGKTATMAQIKAMMNSPEGAGYTEQELIDYYKSQGYTISK